MSAFLESTNGQTNRSDWSAQIHTFVAVVPPHRNWREVKVEHKDTAFVSGSWLKLIQLQVDNQLDVEGSGCRNGSEQRAQAFHMLSLDHSTIRAVHSMQKGLTPIVREMEDKDSSASTAFSPVMHVYNF
jgi:hypothetical protein